jgi:thiamine-phosphate pyrophosphorylase
MKAIVFSPNRTVENEVELVKRLFQEGLEIYHLKKSGYSSGRTKHYIQSIPEEYHNRIVLHNHHHLVKKFNLKGIHFPSADRKKRFRTWFKIKRLKRKRPWITVSTSFHTINKLEDYNDLYDYVFLSPIFDSITRNDYQGGFKEYSLTNALNHSNYKVVALGGVDYNKLESLNRMGFYGCALKGSIWTGKDPIDGFKAVWEKCKSFQ